MSFLLIGVTATAFAIAFVAQWMLSPLRRARIIYAAAGIPTLALTVLLTIAVILAREPWFRAVGVVLFALLFMFLGLVGAIGGSELATFAKRFLRRRR